MSTILIADDNQSIREYCRCELEEEGYHAVTARNGAEAVTLTCQLAPDVVVLDICMPGMDGLEALSRIRHRHPQMAVVLFTGCDDVCLHDERSLQATACIEKSHDLAQLKLAISSILKSRREKTSYRAGLPPSPLTAD